MAANIDRCLIRRLDLYGIIISCMSGLFRTRFWLCLCGVWRLFRGL